MNKRRAINWGLVALKALLNACFLGAQRLRGLLGTGGCKWVDRIGIEVDEGWSLLANVVRGCWGGESLVL
jgi:hypothetical protein